MRVIATLSALLVVAVAAVAASPVCLLPLYWYILLLTPSI